MVPNHYSRVESVPHRLRKCLRENRPRFQPWQLALCLVTSVLATYGNHSTVLADPAGTPVHRPSAAEERIRRALGEQTEIEFIDTPLRDVLQFIGEQHNIQVILDEAALNEEGLATGNHRTARGLSDRLSV